MNSLKRFNSLCNFVDVHVINMKEILVLSENTAETRIELRRDLSVGEDANVRGEAVVYSCAVVASWQASHDETAHVCKC